MGRVFPPIDKFVRICKALDVTPSYLLLPMLELEPKDRHKLSLLYQKPSKAFCDNALHKIKGSQVHTPIKELRKNQEGWDLVKSMMLGIELYLREKEAAKS